MANTLTTISQSMLQDEVLPALQLGLTPLQAFSFAPQDKPLANGDSVIVPVVSSMTAGTYTSTFESGDTTVTGKSVTIGDPIFRSWYINPHLEGIPTVGRFLAAGREAAYAVAKKVLQDVLALCVAANIGDVADTDKKVVTAANYDVDDQADQWEMLKGKGVTGQTSAIHTVAYAAALLKDGALQDRSASGSDMLLTGELPPVLGARQFYTDAFPTAVTDENTGVIYTGKTTAAIAVGAYNNLDESLEAAAGVRNMIVTDDDTGLSMNWRTWVNSATGVYWGSVAVAKGQTFIQNAATRVVSA